jgi:hypothetical protein
MADRHPLAHQNAVYQQDYHRITEMFQAATTQEDAHELFVELDSTLTDPLLPWQFRAEYSIMRAMYSGDDAQAYVEAAEEAVADIVEVSDASPSHVEQDCWANACILVRCTVLKAGMRR